MKLKDLKPNECIVINSRKEAKQLRKLLHKNNIIGYYSKGKLDIDAAMDNYVYVYDGAFSINNDKVKVTYTVKDFINKKSKFKEDISQELARLDNLTNDLSIRVKELEDKPVLSCSKSLTSETLKAITEPVTSVKLEAGKWYKDAYSNFLIYAEEIHEITNDISGYGFYSSLKWFDSKRVCVKNIKLNIATHEEVETALIEEAKRRGFKEGVRFKSASSGDEFTFKGELKLYKYESLTPSLGCVFIKGKWAEIVEEPKQKIDWSKPGQLVINESGYVWMTTGKHEEDSFTGIYIKDGVATPSFTLGCVSKGCAKSSYTLYTEPITLKND